MNKGIAKMNDTVTRPTGWRPIPLALKILAVVMLLWAVGAVMNAPNLMTNGLPLFGVFVQGPAAFAVVLVLDIIGPLLFLYALWTRKSWGPKWAALYMGVFILNSIVAFFTVRADLGLVQILTPTVATLVFLSVIRSKSDYFN